MAVRILQHLSFTTFIMFSFFGILQLDFKKKLPLNYYLSGLFLLAGYQFFYYWAFSIGLLEFAPLLINTEIAVCYTIGPFLYLYFCSMTGAKRMNHRTTLLHFIPFFVSLILLTVYNIGFSSPLDHFIETNLLFPEYTHNPFIRVINSLSDLSMAAYFFITLFQVSILLKKRKISIEVRVVLVFLIILTINETILVIASLLHITELTIFGIGFFSLQPMYYIFFSFRYPEFSLKVIKEAKNIRYERSIAKNLDINLVQTRLTELMEEERLFSREDLSLKSLSEQLKISPHQLSHVLNDRLKMNFSTYVNAFRIEEAKKLLSQRPERSILDIAFSVGFNSKSSFYEYFFKETGVNPTEYRNNMKIPS